MSTAVSCCTGGSKSARHVQDVYLTTTALAERPNPMVRPIRQSQLHRKPQCPSLGVPAYRTKITYVPQRPSLLSGTPRDFLATVTSFRSRKPKRTISGHPNPIEISKAWGIDGEQWDRNWSNLSGGESQRIALAIAVGLNTAEILLLDGRLGCTYC